jgi:hypothetical protein
VEGDHVFELATHEQLVGENGFQQIGFRVDDS